MRAVFWAICALAFALLAPYSTAQSQSDLRVKAAFVFTLTKYVEWPSPKNRLVIGVVGDRSMVNVLQELLTGKVSDARRIEMLVSPSDAELNECDLVYGAYSSRRKIDPVLSKLSTRSVLTVGDADSFTKQGGMISLVTVGDHVAIHVNLQAAQKEKLKISSRLLNLATVINSPADASH